MSASPSSALPTEKISSPPHPNPAEPISTPSLEDDPPVVFSELNEVIAEGQHLLDDSLDAIVRAAQNLTGAAGAAIAMSRDGEMVCRARCGEVAPSLGARLSAESGISGACLRSGTTQHCSDTEHDNRVDADVCRNLGLRSIVVVPIIGWPGTSGILEAFSDKPQAFTESHIVLLEQFAALAERARSSQPQAVSATPEKLTAEETQTPIAEPIHTPTLGDRLREVSEFFGRRSRPLIWGGVGLVAILLLGLVAWLGWQTPDLSERQARAATATTSATSSPAANSEQAAPFTVVTPPSNTAKASAGIKLAAEVNRIPTEKALAEQALQSSPVEPVVPREESRKHTDEISSLQPPVVSAAADSSILAPVLSASASMPNLAPKVSQGVSTGYLIHRVEPIYPPQARMARLQGTVVLDASIAEDGTVREVKVIKGHPMLAQAAMDAVKRWQYKPYELNGQPVQMSTTITLIFNLP